MNTRSGRPTDEAERQIAEAQACSTCSLCLGARRIAASIGPKEYIVACPACLGTVPAGDLAQWRERAEALLRYPNAYSSLAVMGNVLSAHLAAMPQPDVNPELLDNLNTCAGLLGDDYDVLDSKDDSHMAVRIKRVQEALVDARAAIAQVETGAAG